MAKSIEDIKTHDIKKDGGAAFPCCGDPSTDQMVHGMTLRDWFAGMALQGLIASHANPATKTLPNTEVDFVLLSQNSYEYADTMIKARGE